MKIVFIRHGEPTYEEISERKYIGHGRDLAKLTERGILQAEAVSKDNRLKGAQLILSSPYTRALQTAAIISRNTRLEIKVETDLHEWMPDISFQYDKSDYAIDASLEYDRYKGVRTSECRYNWETADALAERAYRCIKQYLHYDKIIVVSHGMIMQTFCYKNDIPHCGILEMDFDINSKWSGLSSGIY